MSDNLNFGSLSSGRGARADSVETSVKPGGASIFTATETAAAAQMTNIDIRDFATVTAYVDITTQGSITTLNVKCKQSGKASPNKDTAADWGIVQADNLDGATGISTVQEYQIQVTVSGTGRFGPFRFPANAGHTCSFRVWVDDATGSVGNVLVYRS